MSEHTDTIITCLCGQEIEVPGDIISDEITKLKAENKAQLAELTAISDALGTREGHSSVSHIEALKEEALIYKTALIFISLQEHHGKRGNWAVEIAKQALKASE